MKDIKYLIGDATQCKPTDYSTNHLLNGTYTGEKSCIIPHICNDIGAWGAGFVIAVTNQLEAKPEAVYRYFHKTNHELSKIGEVQIVQSDKVPYITVVNIIGQNDTICEDNPTPINYVAVRKGLRTVATHILGTKGNENISVHMPRIGCGLAGGKWNIVEQIIIEELCKKDIDVTVYDLQK